MTHSYTEDFANVYELIYRSRGKSWTSEAVAVTHLIRARYPNAESVLDLACGTGAHLETFSTLFSRIAGVELSVAMSKIARQRVPQAVIHHDDMRFIQLDEKFDAITCMFSSIGYLESVQELNASIQRWADHLVPGGVLVIEPWWTPDRFIDNYVAADSGSDEYRSVTRVSHSRRTGSKVRMEVRIVLGNAFGITHFSEHHDLTLFTQGQYLEALEKAGLRGAHLTDYLSGPGLLVGVKKDYL